MKIKLLGALILFAVATAGYLAVNDWWRHTTEPKQAVQETLPTQSPTPVAPVVPQAPALEVKSPESAPVEVQTEQLKPTAVLPPAEIEPSVIRVVAAPEKSNNFPLADTSDHAYRIGFVAGFWRQNFPEGYFNKKILGQLLLRLRQQNVQAVFLADKIEGKSFSKFQMDEMERKLTKFHAYAQRKLGHEVKIFPVIECDPTVSSQLIPLINRIFKFDPKDPFAPYDVTTDTSALVVLPTREFDQKMQLIDGVTLILKTFQKVPQWLFFVGYDPVFPVMSYIRNDTVRNALWKLFIDAKATAYFSFGEQLFNRADHRGIWQIITSGGGAPLRTVNGLPPFYHCVLLRIPSENGKYPIVQSLDLKGEVIDEFELKSSDNPLNQLHISG